MTLHRMEPYEFGKARAVFEPMGHSLAIESIIRGLTPAWILVDDAADLSSALTWFKGRVFLSGDPDDRAFREAAAGVLSGPYRDEIIAHGGRGFLLYHHPEGWGAHLDDALPGASMARATRLYYHLDARSRRWNATPPEGFALTPVDSRLLERTDLENLNQVEDEMLSERLSLKAFLEKSFGYCVVHEGAIVGWCMSEYNAGERCELGIATAEGYRKRGLATLTGRAVIREAVSRGISDIGWHCYASNAPSIATAERLGFRRALEYPVIWVNLG
jgi:RimJ/RimL family protein N-acetyltransferase